jgi:hypothetical protein
MKSAFVLTTSMIVAKSVSVSLAQMVKSSRVQPGALQLMAIEAHVQNAMIVHVRMIAAAATTAMIVHVRMIAAAVTTAMIVRETTEMIARVTTAMIDHVQMIAMRHQMRSA